MISSVELNNKFIKMDLIKIISRLEDKGFNISYDFVENNENILQALIDETEIAINYTRCCKRDSEQFVCDNCDGDGGRNFTEGFLPCPKCKGSGVAN